MSPSVVPIQGVARVGLASNEETANSLLHAGLHGSGHLGISPLDRILLSLQSGIESEIEYALNTLTFYSCNEPKIVDFATYPIIGTELIGYFMRPYTALEAKASSDKIADKIATPSGFKDFSNVLSTSAEALLTLRNAAQDLHNQQWLSQAQGLRRNLARVLQYLQAWFYEPSTSRLYLMSKFNEVFYETLGNVLELIEPLTSFWIENNRHDSLFGALLVLLENTKDKNHLLSVLRSLYHLLFLGGENAVKSRNSETPDVNNCIDAVQERHLRIVVQTLLVSDGELNLAALQFLRQYVRSEALRSNVGSGDSSSVERSQLHRLRKLVEASGDKKNLHILLKQLPQLIVDKLPLIDPGKIQQTPLAQLAKRSTYNGTVHGALKLPPKLYSIIINFPEPLRATTWLRCCYEPYTMAIKKESEAEMAAGEVTQISLWKSYENQFDVIWKDRGASAYPNLLPAVDFIKNVSTAFPSSEAMVVNIASELGQPARKKFIIKGIQPRQFPVGIDVGNFEALRKYSTVTQENRGAVASVGDLEMSVFEEAMRKNTDVISEASEALRSPYDTSAAWYTPINGLSKDLLETIIVHLLQEDSDGEFKNVFRQYNQHWLPDLVYANPGLVDGGYIDGKWLLYLL